MQRPPASLSFDGQAPLRYVGGDPSLDLVNTVDWTERGLENDRLVDYERLTRWAPARRSRAAAPVAVAVGGGAAGPRVDPVARCLVGGVAAALGGGDARAH